MGVYIMSKLEMTYLSGHLLPAVLDLQFGKSDLHLAAQLVDPRGGLIRDDELEDSLTGFGELPHVEEAPAVLRDLVGPAHDLNDLVGIVRPHGGGDLDRDECLLVLGALLPRSEGLALHGDL